MHLQEGSSKDALEKEKEEGERKQATTAYLFLGLLLPLQKINCPGWRQS
jgi:hypothetical protein